MVQRVSDRHDREPRIYWTLRVDTWDRRSLKHDKIAELRSDAVDLRELKS